MTGPAPSATARRILTAELLAVGSELTTGETRDANGGELAASLAAAGVAVRRIVALPDRLDLVVAAFLEALAEVDLVVSTGGLGPTPDDLTREALAAAVGEVPTVDPGLEDWLRAMFARRGIPLPAVNLKQAWRIPSAASIPNENGTAPGWWVDRPDGRIAVLLPGPPRELRPMWTEWAMPRLRERGIGDGRVVRVLRTYGIGESSVVETLGEAMFRAANPVVATYARADWLDVRISAVDEVEPGGRTRPAADVVAAAESRIREVLAGYVRAEGEATWGDVVGAVATAQGVTFATTEAGSGGALAGLLSDVPQLVEAVIHPAGAVPDAGAGQDAIADPGGTDAAPSPLIAAAREVARRAGVPVGLAVAVRADGPHTLVRAALIVPWAGAGEEPLLDLRLFAHGSHGRLRAAVAAAAFLAEILQRGPSGTP